jgi:hypothetical protein
MNATKYKAPPVRDWHVAMESLENTFRLYGVTDFSAQPNVMLSRANSPALSKVERSVTISFKKDGKTVTLSMDTQDTATGNLKALQLCIDDMRMIERRGLAETMQSAYMQLAGPAKERDPWEVLGLRPDASRDEIDAMYRVKARSVHPDAGGSNEAMAELNAAREQALAKVAA